MHWDHYIPPMFIFPRIRAKPELLHDSPAGSVAQYQPKGWMSRDIFLEWMKQFYLYAKPTANNPVLLLLDNHCSHLSLMIVVEYARSSTLRC
jgi:hypothetical protein